MRKLLVMVCALVSILAWNGTSFAGTTQVDSLVEKLVEKGILTRNEGIKLKGEIAADEKIFREAGLKQSLPKWVQSIKLKGDFRLRYQKEKKNLTTENRNRGRIRYRLGIEAEVTDQVTIYAGLASGGDDPRSTNQTFENSFDTGDIRLDYAAVEYAPMEGVQFIGGKFKTGEYLWKTTDLLWDGDINPEGGSMHLTRKLSDKVSGFLNAGVWILEENGTADRSDPFLHYVQLGFGWKDGDYDFKLAGVKYGFNAIKGTCPPFTGGTNTGVTSAGGCTGKLAYDYNPAGASVEFGIKEPFGLEMIERLAFFGDYINNKEAHVREHAGWSAGAKFGDKKVDNRGKWQVKYIFAWLEKDAFPDFLPDSDRYGGKTNVRGHEAVFKVGLAKNVLFGIDYYNTDLIRSTTKNQERLIQGDLEVKF